MSTLHQNDKTLIVTAALVLVGAVAYSVAENASQLLTASIGVGLLALSWLVASTSHGGTASQIGLPALGMAMVALLIHTAHGRTESHFAVFAFLAITVVYRHWLPVVAGAATIAVHHLSFNYFQTWGWGPICFTEPGLLHVIEHALYVIAEAGVLILLVHRARQDFGAALNLIDITDAMTRQDNKIHLDVLERYAHHDHSSVTGKLVNALQRICQVVQQVHTSANLVDNTTSEISSSNLDLSNRTEQAASHLQNTTAAMSDLDDIAQQTATSAHTADQLARNAADVAERGGQVVAQVVSTMNDIDNSSKKISDIVSVINGIALQTNILALNAAVEAARAGEQGKGFAIVAAEVRNLAQRSAAAAHEIKELITNSVHKIESGTQLAAEAGMTMQDIVISVQKVSTLIGEISSAAEHQTGDIRKISSSVHALEQMTQQNAAMVEESAAAATSLSEESRQLVRALELFVMSPAQTGRGHVKAAPSIHQPPAVRATANPSVMSKAKPMSPRPVASPPPLKAPAPKPAATETAHENAEEWTTF